MFDQFYYFFRSTSLESIIQFALFSYALFILCGPAYAKLKNWQYIILSTFLFTTFQTTGLFFFRTFSFTSLLETNMPYWFSFFSMVLIQALSTHLFLKNSFSYQITYILFFSAFVQLFKVICTPLYTAEPTMNPSTYRILDIITVCTLFFLLFLLSILFDKHKIHTSIHIPSRNMVYVLYFPVSILFCYILTSNSITLYPYTNPIIAGIILSNLPVIYYILSLISKSYEEQRRLDDALTQTRVQISRYRFSIELQEQLKKERHELKNNYFYIQTLLNEKKYDQLNNYIENVIGKNLSTLNEVQTGNTLMDYLLNRKVQEAHKYGIKTYVEVLIPSQLNVSEDTLCTILLNLLDNAIEASKNETNPDIHISISCVQNYLVCKIRNKIANNILDINPNLSTTKSDSKNHGLGLKIIRETTKNNNGIFNIVVEEGYFVSTVMLPLEPTNSF